jgi:hypothetical protein
MKLLALPFTVLMAVLKEIDHMTAPKPKVTRAPDMTCSIRWPLTEEERQAA